VRGTTAALKAKRRPSTRAAWWHNTANQGRTSVRERILDARGKAQDGDARNIINAC
jgi:hypothetical protein